MKRKDKNKISLILHNIRSVENVGAMFRTADAGGVNKIYLSGYTPSPVDRFGRKRGDMSKSALGAENFVEWEEVKNISTLIKNLRKNGYRIVAIEQHKNSIDYRKIKLENKTAFIFGNEVSGIEQSILKKCDLIAEIPMYGKKESLNVSVCLGIIIFNYLK